MNILIAYASHDGQTEKIARFLGDHWRAQEHVVDLLDVAHLPNAVALDKYAAVVVGAPVRMGKYPAAMAKFVRAHRTQLEVRRSGFFSVCMAATSSAVATRAKAQSWPQ